MTERSTETTLAGMPLARAQPSQHRLLIIAAWTGMLLLSKLPLVIARELLHTDIPWITSAWIATSVLLVALTFAWRALQPLRAFMVVMVAILLVTVPFDGLMAQTTVWQRLPT